MASPPAADKPEEGGQSPIESLNAQSIMSNTGHAQDIDMNLAPSPSTASPPSSPPTTAATNSTQTLKRSREEMEAHARPGQAGSATVNENEQPSTHDDHQNEASPSSTVTAPSSQVQTQTSRSPPANNASSANHRSMMPPPPPPRQPASSGQGLVDRSTPRKDSIQAQRSGICKTAPTTKRGQPPEEQRPQVQHDPSEDPDSEGSTTLGEPQVAIEDFDWRELEERYHQKMDQFAASEAEIYQDFAGLCNFFNMWVGSLQGHEVERSFKRLKTQMAYVQHDERGLEQKRAHYIKVVEAFQSALHLLDN